MDRDTKWGLISLVLELIRAALRRKHGPAPKPKKSTDPAPSTQAPDSVQPSKNDSVL